VIVYGEHAQDAVPASSALHVHVAASLQTPETGSRSVPITFAVQPTLNDASAGRSATYGSCPPPTHPAADASQNGTACITHASWSLASGGVTSVA
jgi:hypothetical protein